LVVEVVVEVRECTSVKGLLLCVWMVVHRRPKRERCARHNLWRCLCAWVQREQNDGENSVSDELFRLAHVVHDIR
jgi:hypothetical protein